MTSELSHPVSRTRFRKSLALEWGIDCPSDFDKLLIKAGLDVTLDRFTPEQVAQLEAARSAPEPELIPESEPVPQYSPDRPVEVDLPDRPHAIVEQAQALLDADFKAMTEQLESMRQAYEQQCLEYFQPWLNNMALLPRQTFAALCQESIAQGQFVYRTPAALAAATDNLPEV